MHHASSCPILTLALGLARTLGLALALGLAASCGGGGGGGSIDVGSSFNRARGFDSTVWCVRTDLATGRVWVGGSFTAFSDRPAPRVQVFDASGALDGSFDPGTGFDDSVQGIAPIGDGRAWVVGRFTTYDGASRRGVAILTADGALDPVFDPGTGLGTPGFSVFSADAVALADDGSGDAWVGGSFEEYDGVPTRNLVRVAQDGSLVRATPGAGFDDFVLALAPAGDGSGDVYAGGLFTAFDGAAAPGLLRVDGTTGARDPSFDPGAGAVFRGAPGLVWSLALAEDGSGDLLVGGDLDHYDGDAVGNLVRVNADGSRDATLAQGVNGRVQGLAPARDGSHDLWIGGGFFTGTGFGGPAGLARLSPDGTPDPSFAPVGGGFAFGPVQIDLAADGDVVAAGDFGSYAGELFAGFVRIDPSGAVDPSSVPSGGVDGLVYDVLPVPGSGGEVLVCGGFEGFDGLPAGDLLRLHADGTLAGRFGDFLGLPEDLVLDGAGGKVYVTGSFLGYAGSPDNSLVRMDLAGTRDAGFFVGASPSGPDHGIGDAELAPDGGLVVNGPYTSWSGALARNLVKVLPDGAAVLNNAFPGGFVNDFAPLQDGSGRLWVGGNFDCFAPGVPAPRVALLQPVGNLFQLDPGFDPGTGFDLPPRAVVAVGTAGAAIFGGDLREYDGRPVGRIARLLPDGRLDPAFDAGAGFDAGVDVLALAADGTGDLYVSGRFSHYDGRPVPNLVRLHRSGALDPGFSAGRGFNGAVRRIVPLGEGSREVYVCGSFSTYDGVFTGTLVRLNADGSAD